MSRLSEEVCDRSQVQGELLAEEIAKEEKKVAPSHIFLLFFLLARMPCTVVFIGGSLVPSVGREVIRRYGYRYSERH